MNLLVDHNPQPRVGTHSVPVEEVYSGETDGGIWCQVGHTEGLHAHGLGPT